MRMLAGSVCALTLLGNAKAQDIPVEQPAAASAPTPVTAPAPSSASGMPSPGNVPRSPSNVEALQLARQESIRRQEIGKVAMQEFQEGKAYELNGQISEARAKYVSALEKFKTIDPASPQYRDVANHLIAMNYALIDRGVHIGAREAVKSLARENLTYNPNDKQAQILIARIEKAQRDGLDTDLLTNLAINPNFAKKVADVEVWFVEIDQYFRTGQLDKAKERCELILSRDNYNKAAMDWKSRIIKKQQEFHKGAQGWSRDRALNDVIEAFGEKHNPNMGLISLNPTRTEITRTTNDTVNRRLREIILPKVDFSQASIRQVAEVFSSLSRQYDPDGKGITFAVRPEAEREARPVTLTMHNAPMSQVLRYATQLAGVKVRVEDVGVFIVSANADDSVMLRRSFNVSPAFFTAPPTPVEGNGATGPGGTRARTRPQQRRGSGTSTDEVRQTLEEKGIRFPAGASAVYFPDQSVLQVVNSQDQLDYMEALFEGGERAYMVDVSCKIVEIGQEDLNDLTFNYGFNLIPTAPGFNPFDPGLSISPAVSSTSTALRGSNGLNNSGIDALLSGVLVPNPSTLKIGASISGVDFQAVISALAQKKSFDVLSMPHVRVKSGEDARLNAIRTFRFPIEFDPPESVEATNNSNTTTGGTTTGVLAQGPPTVIPTFPRTFQAQDIGVKLAAKPQVAADSSNIDLSLVPELVDFDGFINYGDPIFVVNRANEQLLMSNNRIPQPVFSRRTIATKVTVKDSYTVVMGGLLREDVQTINDRVPFLGDMPLVGRLFQSKASRSTKKNLLIFTTCTIYLNNGERLSPPTR